MDSYHFEYAMDFIEYPLLGDYHASELVFVFDNQWPIILHDFSAKDKQMATWFGTYVSDARASTGLDSLCVMRCSTPVAAAVVEPGSIRIVSGGGHSVVSLVVALCCCSHV
jgi:hypothetical protein